MLGRWGKKVGEATKKAEDLAGNTWQHREFSFFCVYANVIYQIRYNEFSIRIYE